MASNRENANLAIVSGEQQQARNMDMALSILIIPGIGALTPDKELEVAQAKGRVLAIQNEYAERCGREDVGG